MSFLGKYLTEAVRDAHRGVNDFIVNFDPERAGEADVAEVKANVDSAEAIASRADTKAQEDEKARDALKVRLDQHIKAVEKLSAEAEAMAEGPARTAKEKGVEKLMTDAEALKAQHAAAVAAADDSRAYAKERLEVHGVAVQKMRTLRTRLDTAARDRSRAEQDAALAAQRKSERLATAGITRDNDTGSVAIAAMERQTAALRQQAAGNRLTTNALTQASEGDEEATRALAEASGTAPALQGDIKSRLAALKG